MQTLLPGRRRPAKHIAALRQKAYVVENESQSETDCDVEVCVPSKIGEGFFLLVSLYTAEKAMKAILSHSMVIY